MICIKDKKNKNGECLIGPRRRGFNGSLPHFGVINSDTYAWAVVTTFK